MSAAPRYLRLLVTMTHVERTRYEALVHAYETRLGKLADRQREALADAVKAGQHPRYDRIAGMQDGPTRPAA